MKQKTSGRLKALDRLLKSQRPRSALEIGAIERQKLDLEEGKKRGLVWDETAAQRAVDFFGLLSHWKGEWAGRPFTLEPWQEHCIVAPLFGWKREDGLRRFRTAYIEVPRKNGKTFLASGIGLHGLVADQEPGAEVYSAATMRDQACILFNDAKRSMGPELRRLIKTYQYSLSCEQLNSTFKPLSADHDSLDGLNIHRAIVDELHAHKDRGLWDVLDTATGARRQPLIVAITTAGADRQSICWEVRGLAVDAITGQADHNDSFFGFITCAEDDDAWDDPRTWEKANPNYDISVKPEKLREAVIKAKASGSAENNFRRKHLNQWMSGVSTWIAPEKWKACELHPFPDKTGAECFGAIDIGWRDDFAAFGRVFPDRVAIERPEPKEGEPEPYALARCMIRRAWVDTKIWIPESGRRDITKAPLCNWIKQGLVTVTSGNTTDPYAIFDEVMRTAKTCQLKRVAIDPNNARQFGSDLIAAGIEAFEFFQSKRNYNEPSKEFERLVVEKKIFHNGDPLLSWMIGNVVMEEDARGYVMPAKNKSNEKIDGPVSLLMAFAMALFAEFDEAASIYDRERRGFQEIF